MSALFLPIDVPIEDNEWRDRLLVELRRIAAAPEEPVDLRGMAELQLQQAKVQKVLLQQRKQGRQ